MLSNSEIEQYRLLKKQTDEANIEKQTMKAEIQVITKQGLERLKKYGLESYSEIPKLKAMLEELEEKINQEKQEMTEFCTYMATKKAEKQTAFNKD